MLVENEVEESRLMISGHSFLQPVANQMTTHVESALEESSVRQQQQLKKPSLA